MDEVFSLFTGPSVLRLHFLSGLLGAADWEDSSQFSQGDAGESVCL